MPTKEHSILLELVLLEIKRTQDAYYAGELLKILSIHKLGDETSVCHILELHFFEDQHPFRDKAYEWITALNIADRFWSYGLEGIHPLIKYNKKIKHGSSELRLEAFFLSFKHRGQLYSLIKKISSAEWRSFYRYNSSHKKGFVYRLFEKCISLYNEDPLIILPIVGYIKSIDKAYLKDELLELDHFLEVTQTHSLVVRLLIKDIFTTNGWELGSFITPASFDYLLFEFEESGYDAKVLRMPLAGLRWEKRSFKYDEFYAICKDATDNTIYDQSDALDYQQMQMHEEQKVKNDLKYIQSLAAFKKGIKQFFAVHGKKSITDQGIIMHMDSRSSRRITDSNFIFNYVYHWRMNGHIAYIEDCLKFIEKEGNFSIFQAEEILGYHHRSEHGDKVLLPILKQYYYATLPNCQFENSIWIDNQRYHFKTHEERCGRIFDKFEFPTQQQYLVEFMWLDTSGLRGLENAKLNNKETLTSKVLKQLDESGLEVLKNRVIENIRTGIKMESVLASHLVICKLLKITKAKSLIWDILQKGDFREIYLEEVSDIYLGLGGGKEELTIILENNTNYNDSFYTYLLKILSDTHPRAVIDSGVNALRSEEVEEKNKVAIAKQLIQLGNAEAFLFLVDILSRGRKAPYHIQSELSVHMIDTTLGLKALEDLMYLMVDPTFYEEVDFYDSAKSIIAEWLFAFAAKSEKDLAQTTGFVIASEKKLSHLFPTASNLNWYHNKMVENFRNSDKTSKSIKEIKEILRHLQL